MANSDYHVVRHRDGWAFRLGDEYSHVYPSQKEAAEAARTDAIAMFDPSVQRRIVVEREDGSLDESWNYGLGAR